MAKDPFTQVYDKLWALLEAHGGFRDQVRLMNRIKLDSSDPAPRKSNIQDADLPETTLEPAGGEIQLFATSTSSRAVQSFGLAVHCGDQRVHEVLFPLKYELMKALSKSGDNLGLEFVRKVRITDGMEAPAEGIDARGKRGWLLTLTIHVEIWVTTASLKA